MCRKPNVVVAGDQITITSDDSSVTVSRDEWGLITEMVNHPEPVEGNLGRLFRHPVTPAKWKAMR